MAAAHHLTVARGGTRGLSGRRRAGNIGQVPMGRAGMRRQILDRLLLVALGGALAGSLGGCQFVGNPTDGAGRFFANTHTFKSNPNLPPVDSETAQRVVDDPKLPSPLLAEAGNVWPGPIKPLPTLEQLSQPGAMESLPPPQVPASAPPLLFPQSE
jgi:hypothetical protein